MCVVVSFLETGLMHVAVAVLGSVVVGVGVLVLDVLVFVRGVRVRVSDPAVLVFVRMWPFMGVLLSHPDCLLYVKHIVSSGCND